MLILSICDDQLVEQLRTPPRPSPSMVGPRSRRPFIPSRARSPPVSKIDTYEISAILC